MYIIYICPVHNYGHTHTHSHIVQQNSCCWGTSQTERTTRSCPSTSRTSFPFSNFQLVRRDSHFLHSDTLFKTTNKIVVIFTAPKNSRVIIPSWDPWECPPWGFETSKNPRFLAVLATLASLSEVGLKIALKTEEFQQHECFFKGRRARSTVQFFTGKLEQILQVLKCVPFIRCQLLVKSSFIIYVLYFYFGALIHLNLDHCQWDRDAPLIGEYIFNGKSV